MDVLHWTPVIEAPKPHAQDKGIEDSAPMLHVPSFTQHYANDLTPSSSMSGGADDV